MRTPSDLTPILAKLRCRVCLAPVTAGGGAPRCAAGHPFDASVAVPGRERKRDHLLNRVPSVYRAKTSVLRFVNSVPRDTIDPWTAGREVLDLGCGPLQYLYDPDATAVRVGLDRSPEAIARADRSYPRSVHFVARLDDPLPFADRSFDTTLLLFVLHHLPPAIVPAVVAEAARVARRHVVVFDHTRSDVPWQREVQQGYWDAFDGGDLYRSQGEWDELWRGYRVEEHRRMGRMFKNMCYYRIAL